MKIWFLNGIMMLGAVAYAAFLAPAQTSYSHSPIGPIARTVAMEPMVESACSCDYCLGFGDTISDVEATQVGTTNQEPAKDAAKGKDTDAASAKDGAKAEPVADTTEKPTYLIYFTATWCGPCQSQKPIIHEIKDAGKYKVYIVDIDNDPNTAASWGVNTVPTVATVVKGKITYRGVGAGHSRPFLESKLEPKP
jgi:thioredoxin 1